VKRKLFSVRHSLFHPHRHAAMRARFLTPLLPWYFMA
jgi:hypothetical protein